MMMMMMMATTTTMIALLLFEHSHPCVHRSIIAADCSAKIVIFRCHAPPVDLHPRQPTAFLFSGVVQRLTPQCSQWTRLLDVMALALEGGGAGVERLDGRMSGADR